MLFTAADRAEHWPGVSSLDALRHGRALVGSRPAHFFREEGSMPESVELKFERPAGFDHLTRVEFHDLVMERVRSVEDSVRANRLHTGNRVLGRRGVLHQDWRDRPMSREPRRNLSPRVAARNKWSRIEALLRNQAFREAYAEARSAFLHGVRDALFPAGTYWLRHFAQVTCDPRGAPA